MEGRKREGETAHVAIAIFSSDTTITDLESGQRGHAPWHCITGSKPSGCAPKIDLKSSCQMAVAHAVCICATCSRRKARGHFAMKRVARPGERRCPTNTGPHQHWASRPHSRVVSLRGATGGGPCKAFFPRRYKCHTSNWCQPPPGQPPPAIRRTRVLLSRSPREQIRFKKAEASRLPGFGNRIPIRLGHTANGIRSLDLLYLF